MRRALASDASEVVRISLAGSAEIEAIAEIEAARSAGATALDLSHMKLTELSEAIATHSVEIADPLRQPLTTVPVVKLGIYQR